METCCGGEEFIILLPNTDITRSLEITEKIRLIFEKTYSNGKLILSITVSIGVAEYKDEKQGHPCGKKLLVKIPTHESVKIC